MSGRQVDSSHYDWRSYNVKGRWLSYWHQIDEVLDSEPATCLEIGVGSGVVRDMLTIAGVTVTAVDIDEGLGVDRVGDIRALPAEDEEFDVILCSQVLEHIPWQDVPKAVSELHRVARDRVVVSVPQSGRSIRLAAEFTGLGSFSFAARKPTRRPHAWDGQHYWQVGARGTRNAAVERVLQGNGRFAVRKNFVVPEFTFHRFYILQKL